MKKTIIALAALAFSGAILAGGPSPMAAPAAPQDNLYLGFHIDMTSDFYQADANNWGKASTPLAFNQAGFQVGMLFGAIRAEVSIDYSNRAANRAGLSAFLKGAYDLALGHGLTVYPVAGIGFIHSFQETNDTNSNNDFAWLLGAGTTLALNDKTSISGEYNWINNSKDQVGTYTTAQKDFGKNIFSVRWNRTF